MCPPLFQSDALTITRVLIVSLYVILSVSGRIACLRGTFINGQYKSKLGWPKSKGGSYTVGESNPSRGQSEDYVMGSPHVTNTPTV